MFMFSGYPASVLRWRQGPGQIKMMLTWLGWHSTIVVTGDPDQSDLLDGLSGLGEIARRLDPITDIAVVRLAEADIVRHSLVAEMLMVL